MPSLRRELYGKQMEMRVRGETLAGRQLNKEERKCDFLFNSIRGFNIHLSRMEHLGRELLWEIR
jgi:hypothetical protein